SRHVATVFHAAATKSSYSARGRINLSSAVTIARDPTGERLSASASNQLTPCYRSREPCVSTNTRASWRRCRRRLRARHGQVLPLLEPQENSAAVQDRVSSRPARGTP